MIHQWLFFWKRPQHYTGAFGPDSWSMGCDWLHRCRLLAPFLNNCSHLEAVESLSNLIQGFVNIQVTSWWSIM
jgi:hypothetical protein